MQLQRRNQRLDGSNVTLKVYVDGDGPGLVVLPSYGRGAGDDFDAFASRVSAAGFRVLRPEPRGIAGSLGPMEGVSLHDLANDVALVIRELSNGSAFVLGHAFGHAVAKMVAADHPSLVSGVILASAQCSAVPSDINQTPRIACNLAASKEDRLAALRKRLFTFDQIDAAMAYQPPSGAKAILVSTASGGATATAGSNVARELSKAVLIKSPLVKPKEIE